MYQKKALEEELSDFDLSDYKTDLDNDHEP